MTFRAVLFDMDGTLVDSIPAWHKTFNDALVEQGGKPVSYDYFCSDILGQSTEQDISRFFPDMTVDELVGLYDRFFPDNTDGLSLFDSTLEVLDYLEEKGIKKAIVTNTPRELMIITLEKVGIYDRFDLLLGGSDVANGKPDPEMINLACEKLCIASSQALLVGDTFADVEAGKRSFVKTIGIGVNGDWKVDSLDGVITLFDELI